MLTGFAHQLLDRFIEMTFMHEAVVFRRNGPHQTRQFILLHGLSFGYPTQQRFCGVRNRRSLGGGVTGEQNVRLLLLAVVIQQPAAFAGP